MISIKHVNRLKTKNAKKYTKKEREVKRLNDKRSSPGVPPNTCPYIDMVITMIGDLQDSYERLYEKGEHSPVVEDIHRSAVDMMEYIRKNNETLRDNSLYWYNRYKKIL
jgi:septation ring formation regulator EzrA